MYLQTVAQVYHRLYEVVNQVVGGVQLAAEVSAREHATSIFGDGAVGLMKGSLFGPYTRTPKSA